MTNSPTHHGSILADIVTVPSATMPIHSTLHKALFQAVSDGLIPRNAADVKAPRPASEEMCPLSEGEARTF